MKLVLALCSLALASVPASDRGVQEESPTPEKVELRWRGKAGDVLRQRMTMTQAMSGMFGDTESSTQMVMSIRVVEVDADGTGSVAVEYEALRSRMSGFLEADYDSTRSGEEAEKNDEMLASTYGPLVGAELGMRIASSGRVLEVTGMDDVFRGLSDDVRPLFETMFSGEALRRMFETNVFPDEALQVGATWEREIALDLPLVESLTVTYEYELVGFEEIDGERTAKLRVGAEADLDAGSELPIEFAQVVTGEQHVSLASGFVVRSSLTTELKAGSTDAETAFEMDMTMGVEIERIAADAPPFD